VTGTDPVGGLEAPEGIGGLAGSTLEGDRGATGVGVTAEGMETTLTGGAGVGAGGIRPGDALTGSFGAGGTIGLGGGGVVAALPIEG
jgi:hypothetical protein